MIEYITLCLVVSETFEIIGQKVNSLSFSRARISAISSLLSVVYVCLASLRHLQAY